MIHYNKYLMVSTHNRYTPPDAVCYYRFINERE